MPHCAGIGVLLLSSCRVNLRPGGPEDCTIWAQLQPTGLKAICNQVEKTLHYALHRKPGFPDQQAGFALASSIRRVPSPSKSNCRTTRVLFILQGDVWKYDNSHGTDNSAQLELRAEESKQDIFQNQIAAKGKLSPSPKARFPARKSL